MLRRTFLIFVLLSAVFLIGCGKTETGNNNNSMTKDGDKTATTTGSPATTASSSGEKIGIPECDDFITKYEACVNANVPEAQRAQSKETLAQWRKTWRQLAENPMTKGAAAAACRQAAEQAKTSMKSYNCTF